MSILRDHFSDEELSRLIRAGLRDCPTYSRRDIYFHDNITVVRASLSHDGYGILVRVNKDLYIHYCSCFEIADMLFAKIVELVRSGKDLLNSSLTFWSI